MDVSTRTPVVTGKVTQAVSTSANLSSIPGGSTHALLTVNTGGGDIRYWEDGSTPTTTDGLLVPAGSAAELTNLANVKLVATTGTVTVNISYRKYA